MKATFARSMTLIGRARLRGAVGAKSVIGAARQT
jgi:hypothetical protein